MRYEQADLVVVGGGIMGACTAWRAAARGLSVILVDRYQPGHAMGSSHGESRIYRYAYEDEVYVELMRFALGLWRELEAEARETLVYRTGGLDLAPGPHAYLDRCRAAMRHHSIGFEDLDAGKLQERFPQFRLPPGGSALYQADAGLLAAGRCVAGAWSAARRRGVRIFADTEVKRLDLEHDRPTAVSVDTAFRGRAMAVAAGSWAGRVLPWLAPSLKVTRQQYGLFDCADPAKFSPGRFPVFVIQIDPPEAYLYGLPIFERDGVKAAFMYSGEEVDPETARRQPDPKVLEKVRRRLGEWVPEAAGRALHGQVCLYTQTPDQHFVLDRHPGRDGVAVAAGFSGHGFKFGPLVGQILTELAADGATEHRIATFSATRKALQEAASGE